MKYVENPKINEKIAGIIEELKQEIIFHFRPKSIILSGSFGRGEATIIEENGKLRFLSDCEIILIPYKWIFNRKKLDEFQQDFYERTGLKVEIGGATLTFYLSLPFMNKRMKPTIANYDLKYGSKVIYGKNYLKKIPEFKPEGIPLSEGIKLILNRIAEALKHFSIKNPTEEMIFWTDKIVLACQDALLLSLRKYHHSYKKRNELFQIYFPELALDIPNFLDITMEATHRKLTGKIEVVDPLKYWFIVSELCEKVLRYLLGSEFKSKIDYGLYELYIYLKNNMDYNLSSFLKFCAPTPFRPIFKQYLVYYLVFLAYLGLKDERYLKRCFELLFTLGISPPTSTKQLLNQIVSLWECIK